MGGRHLPGNGIGHRRKNGWIGMKSIDCACVYYCYQNQDTTIDYQLCVLEA